MTTLAVTDSDLAAMRAQALELMPDTAVIVRPTYGADGQGGRTETGTTTVATVACRLMPATQNQRERQLAERIGSDFDWLITLPYGSDVRAADRLTIGTRSFEVVGMMTPHSWDTAVRVAGVEIL